jgi:hypothetical protein
MPDEITKGGEKKKKAPQNRKPSLRMRKAAKILMENKGKSLSGAMRKAGYPATTAKNPQQVTKSKSWQQLMDEYLPQEFVAEKHKELFLAEDVVFIPRGKKILERRRPDHAARRAAIDMAHKLRGSFAPEKIELSKRKFGNMSNAELAEVIAKAKKALLKS